METLDNLKKQRAAVVEVFAQYESGLINTFELLQRIADLTQAALALAHLKDQIVYVIHPAKVR